MPRTDAPFDGIPIAVVGAVLSTFTGLLRRDALGLPTFATDTIVV